MLDNNMIFRTDLKNLALHRNWNLEDLATFWAKRREFSLNFIPPAVWDSWLIICWHFFLSAAECLCA